MINCCACSQDFSTSGWRCKKCEVFICLVCKPVTFLCDKNHSYALIEGLHRFSCKKCKKQCMDISRKCQSCDKELCSQCGKIQKTNKIRCENNHLFKRLSTEFACDGCNEYGTSLYCGCSKLCENCYSYLLIPTAFHPGILCNEGHALHVFENLYRCNFCKNDCLIGYSCNDCKVFACSDCVIKIVKNINNQSLVCEKQHRLQ